MILSIASLQPQFGFTTQSDLDADRIVVTNKRIRCESALFAVPLVIKEKTVGAAIMFGMKSKKEKLETKLAKLREEAFKLSHTNRTKSDEKTAEAEELQKQIDAMD